MHAHVNSRGVTLGSTTSLRTRAWNISCAMIVRSLSRRCERSQVTMKPTTGRPVRRSKTCGPAEARTPSSHSSPPGLDMMTVMSRSASMSARTGGSVARPHRRLLHRSSLVGSTLRMWHLTNTHHTCNFRLPPVHEDAPVATLRHGVQLPWGLAPPTG
jgi:hypothetical protein